MNHFMLMSLRSLLLLLSLSLLPSILAAQAVVQLPKKVHDFGEVYEDSDSVICTFDVINAGDRPMHIEGVYVSCGCTAATFSKEAVAPGKKGHIYVSFFPKDLQGKYLKSIYIYTNTLPRKNVVRIKALVTPPKKD